MSQVWAWINYWAVAALIVIGLFGILVRQHLMRKLMAMNILQVGVIFFFISLSYKSKGSPPVLDETLLNPIYVNPLPHALMLTAIVVGISTTGVALALLIRIRRHFDTLNEPELLKRMREK